MKRIVWIAVLLLAVSGVAYGMRSDLPEGDTTAPTVAEVTPVVAEEPAAGEPTQAEPAPEDPMFGRTMGMPGATPARTATTPRRRGGFAMTTTPRAVAPARIRKTRKTYKVKLHGEKTAVVIGPIEIREGFIIKIGDDNYRVEVLEVGEEVQGIEKTPNQLKLEHKLRDTPLDNIQFEGAPLMEVVDYLSEAGDVNIVVTDSVQKTNLKITLRLKNIPLYDVIRYVAEVIGIGFRIDDHAVVITEHAVPSGGELPQRGRGR